jgi:hypothetical protein
LKIIKSVFIVVIFISYFYIFCRTLPPEISYTAVRVENINSSEVYHNTSGQDVMPFQLNGKLGYMDAEGKITYMENLLYGAAIDKNGFINYSKQNEVLVYKDNEGSFLNTVDIAGYPYFTESRRFIISYDSNETSEIDMESNILWHRTFASSLSSLSANESLVLIGTMDGRLQLINKFGNIVFAHDMKESRINVIYGGSVSADGENLLTISGIDPQIMTLWAFSDDNYYIEANWSLNSELRRSSITGFSDDGSFAYSEADGQLLLINLKNNRVHSIKMTGRIQNIDFPGKNELIHILFRDEEGYYLSVIENDGDSLYNIRLAGSNILLKRDADRVVFGINSSLITYNMGPM